MPKIDKNEIVSGVVVYQEPAVLVTLPDTLTNARDEHVVNNKRFFLVLEPYDNARWLCVPLFGEKEGKEARLPIVRGDKRGHSGWTSFESLFSINQFWAISGDDMVIASDGVEFSYRNKRNSYVGDLAEIIRHKADSDVEYRHVSILPVSV